MPKQIPLAIKKEWLKEYEEGKTEARIAREQKHSLNVIKRGIEEARANRDGYAARAEIVKDALKNHQKQLMAVIERLLKLSDPPPADLELRREKSGALTPIPLAAGRIVYTPAEGLTVELWDESTPQWGLLKEHLRRGRIWPAIKQWKDSLIAHIRARIEFESGIKALIESETGIRVASITPVDKNRKFDSVSPFAVNLFYEVSIRKALGISDETNPQERITASDDGYVRHGGGGSELAYCPGKQDPCRDALIRAFGKIQDLPETAKLVTSDVELKRVSRKLKESLEDIQLMGLVSGRCRICNRISL